MLIENDHILIKRGPKENRFRPSIDALFRSAAYTYGPRTIGIVLTGLLNDGTSGMWSVKRLGGLGIIQEPEEAMYPSMPESVLEYVDVDYIVPISEMAPLVCRLIEDTLELVDPASSSIETDRMNLEIHTAAQANASMDILKMGELTPLTCPDCNGTLVSIKEGKLIRYRCHTGHAFTASALLAEVSKSVEDKLWQSVRGLEEMMLLLEQAGKQLEKGGNAKAAKLFNEKAQQANERGKQLRKFIFSQEQLSEEKIREE
ncbi:chemotaxis protein CheB [Rhabdobacter roseus]